MNLFIIGSLRCVNKINARHDCNFVYQFINKKSHNWIEIEIEIEIRMKETFKQAKRNISDCTNRKFSIHDVTPGATPSLS